jgi:dihydrofolate synthase / folylpolyglutamate synthase
MKIKDLLNKLFSLHTFGIKLGLENIKKFLDLLGNPEQKLKTFHIAGSNGKGSTSHFISSILQEFGYKTGLYTSPHFVRFNERLKFIDENKLTFFEVTTALAFQYFYDKKVDYAVIETGLGGRLDATNVINPLASVITSISLEHTHILGNEIKLITAEKAEIIKPKSRAFIGKLPEEAEKIIEEKCSAVNAELFKITDYTNERNGILELYTEEIELDEWNMPLKGDYQKYNAALAGLVVSKTLDKRNFANISQGILNVIKNTRFQGRYEYIRRNPDVIFDSAHNVEGIENFTAEFKKDMEKYSGKILLFGAMRDKPAKEMLSILKNCFNEFHLTELQASERSWKIDELMQISEELNIKAVPEPDLNIFIKRISNYSPGQCVVVLGSIYLLGELKSFLIKEKSS